MTSSAAQILQYFNVDEQKDADLISSFNVYEKGSDCMIIHPGSHSIKYGLASMSQPHLVATAIAHPSKNGKKCIQDFKGLIKINQEKQVVFNQEYSQVIQPIEGDLRKKKHLLVDQKSLNNMRKQYKIFDQGNAVYEMCDKGTYDGRPVDEDAREVNKGVPLKEF